MKNFKVLFADGVCINQNTLVNGKNISDETMLCRVIKSAWCRWTGSKNFTEWAKELNEDGNYEGTFTTENALDNLSSNFHIELVGKAISTYEFFQKHLPLKQTT